MNGPDALRELVLESASGGREAVLRAGEALRAEAERRARRMDPAVEEDLLGRETAVRRVRGLLPWWRWAVGTALHLRGRPAEAVPFLEAAYGAFRRAGEDLQAARVCLLLVDAMACGGRHRAAMARGRWALRVFGRAGDRGRRAAMLVNLGGVEESRDRIVEAMRLWRRAERSLPAGEPLRRGLLAANLAAGSLALGRFAESERRYLEAVRLLEQAGARGSALQARLGLAELEALRGGFRRAVDAVNEIRRLAAAAGDRNLQLEAEVLLAEMEWRMGHLAAAAAAAARAEPHAEETGRLRDASLLAVVRALALAEEGAPEAEEAVRRALRRLDSAGTPLLHARFLVDLAAVGWTVEAGALRGAVRRLERNGLRSPAALGRLLLARSLPREDAAAICERVLAERGLPPWLRMEAHRLAGVLSGPGDMDRAYRQFRRSAEYALAIRSRLPSSTDREVFSRRMVPLAEDAVRILSSGREAVWGRRARRLLARLASAELLDELKRRLEERTEDGAARRWRALREEIRGLLELEEGRGPSRSRSGPAPAVRSRELAARLESLEREVARRYPVLAEERGRRKRDGARFLRAGEVAVELAPAGPDLALFVHRPGFFAHRLLPGRRREMDRLQERLELRMARLDHGRRWLERGGDGLVAQLTLLLEELGERLLGSVVREIADAKLLFVVPHGGLLNLPWSALRLGGRPLVERAPLSLLPSLDVLAVTRRQGTPRPGRPRFGVAGAPAQGLTLVEAEVGELGSILPRCRSAVPATVEDAWNLLARCDAVHFSTHGAFRHDWPMASGIRLADGWLTAASLMGRRSRARLVTVGACDVGRVTTSGGLELRGFLRALLGAGVGCAVLASSPMDDGVAREAALGFYRELRSAGPAEAFRRTVLGLRERYPHPALWGAWQLYGDPEVWEAR